MFYENDILSQKIDELEEKTQNVDAKDFILSNDSHEVAVFLARYIAHKISKKFDCTPCNELLQERSTDSIHFNHPSRGSLTIPSLALSDLVSKGFGLVDYFDDLIYSQCNKSVRLVSSVILHKLTVNFACNSHRQKIFNFIIRVIINIFFNNRRRLAGDSVVQSSIASF